MSRKCLWTTEIFKFQVTAGFRRPLSEIICVLRSANCYLSVDLSSQPIGQINCLKTHLITPSNRIFWEANRFSASQKKITDILWNPKFSNWYTSARQLSLTWASSIQSITPHSTSWRSILILSSHLRLGMPRGLFPRWQFSTVIKALYNFQTNAYFVVQISKFLANISLSTFVCLQSNRSKKQTNQIRIHVTKFTKWEGFIQT